MRSLVKKLYPSIWKSIHICALMLPSNNQARRAYKTWIHSFRYLLPFKYATTLAIFLDTEPIDKYLHSTNEELFNWTYRLHKFVNDEKAKQTKNNVFQPSLKKVRQMYSNIHKKFWANPMWIVIHGLVTLYPTFPSKEYRFNFQLEQYRERRKTYKTAYRTFMYSLKYILPCEMCRKHLKQNLSKINLDVYLDAPIDLFYFTWYLHSIVNKHVEKVNISFKEACTLYGIKV